MSLTRLLTGGDFSATSLREAYGYADGWGRLGPDLTRSVIDLMSPGGMRTESRSSETEHGQSSGQSSALTRGGGATAVARLVDARPEHRDDLLAVEVLLADHPDRPPDRLHRGAAVGVVGGPVGVVVLLAVVLRQEHQVGYDEVAASQEASVLVEDVDLGDRRRQSALVEAQAQRRLGR